MAYIERQVEVELDDAPNAQSATKQAMARLAEIAREVPDEYEFVLISHPFMNLLVARFYNDEEERRGEAMLLTVARAIGAEALLPVLRSTMVAAGG